MGTDKTNQNSAISNSPATTSPSSKVNLRDLKELYHKSSRINKAILLDQLCEKYGYHRKHAIRLMRETTQLSEEKCYCREKRYTTRVLQYLVEIRLLSGYPGVKRLADIIPTWLPILEHIHGELSQDERQILLTVSHATIGRLFKAQQNTIDINKIKNIAITNILDMSPFTSLRTAARVGNVWFTEITIINPNNNHQAKALLASDAFSGWTNIIEIKTTATEALVDIINSLPFKITCVYITASSPALVKAAQNIFWQSEEAVPIAHEIREDLDLNVLKYQSEPKFIKWLNYCASTCASAARGHTPKQIVVESEPSTRELLQISAKECYETALNTIEGVISRDLRGLSELIRDELLTNLKRE